MPLSIMQKINRGLVIAFVLTAFSYLVGLMTGVFSIENFPWLEGAAVFLAYVCTYMCVMQSRWNYPIGAASTVLFVYVFVYAPVPLYASAILNFYLTFTLIYGWFRWRPDADTRPVTSILDSRWYVVAGYAFLALAAYGMAYNTNFFVVKYLGAQYALLWADVVIFVFSVVAQIMLDNKKLENWLVWLIVNIFAVVVYTNAGLYIIAIQMGLFGLNAIWGYIEWRKTMLIKNPYPINM